MTVEIADPRGQRFEAVGMPVDTGATFTKVPKDLLEAAALEDAMLAVDPHSRRLIPVDALEMTITAE